MSPPALTVRQVDRGADPLLRNLMQHYLYDMAEWFEFDMEADGTYAHATDRAWLPERAVFFAFVGTIPVGFALVGPLGDQEPGASGRDLNEFFVVRRHRRAGLGRAFASDVWSRYPGRWLVRVYAGNRPAVPFWRATVAGYTDGAYEEAEVRAHDRDWRYFRFDAPRPPAA